MRSCPTRALCSGNKSVKSLALASQVHAALRMLFGQEPQRRAVASSCNACESWIGKIVPVDPDLHGDRFWWRKDGRLVATPLFVALFVIETTDVVFALDSILSVLAVSHDPLIVYSSNIMAMLGMRSLYFVLAEAIEHLRYLRQGLATILIFTGTKMLNQPVDRRQCGAFIGGDRLCAADHSHCVDSMDLAPLAPFDSYCSSIRKPSEVE